jgi:hypothetical protein
MDPHTINLIVSLISGIIGGNIVGAAMPEKNLGGVVNSLSGLVGGGIGGYILKALGVAAAATAATQTGAAPAPEHVDIASILANIGGGGAGGAILTAIIAMIKNATDKNS